MDYLETSKENGMLGLGFNPGEYNIVGHIFSNGNRYSYGEYGFLAFADSYDDDVIYVIENAGDLPYNTMRNEILHDLFKNGYIRSDWVTCDNKGTDYSLAGENYITRSHNGYTYADLEKLEASTGRDLEIIFDRPDLTRKTGYETGVVIPSQCTEPERAMMFISLLYSDEKLYQMIVYGLEGEHYTKNADGTITIPEDVTYKGISNWHFGTCANSFTTDLGSINYYSDLKTLEEEAGLSAFWGFKPDLSSITVEVENMKAVNKEYTYLWAYDDYAQRYEEQQKDLKAAGSEKVADVVLEQLITYAEETGRTVEIIEVGK